MRSLTKEESARVEVGVCPSCESRIEHHEVYRSLGSMESYCKKCTCVWIVFRDDSVKIFSEGKKHGPNS